MSRKILIIDDSKTVRDTIRSYLKDEGAELLIAGHGEDGIRMAHSETPDLILLDVEMPAPNGFEVCRQLKSDDITAGIPVIFLTGLSSTAEKVCGLDLGAIDYVTKPCDPAELCARVRASLRSKYMLDLLSQKAMIDGLTGLWNRAYLDLHLKSEASLASRYGHRTSVIMADVDKFKSINDQHGHPFGDEVLGRIARILDSDCRTEDMVCRYGGEEFVILAPMIPLEGATALAEHFRQVIHGTVIRHREQDVRLSCSFGVAELAHENGESLMERADAALYRAKQSGRNRVVCADPTSPPLAAVG
jgi:two-component system, cell cycle response regulator